MQEVAALTAKALQFEADGIDAKELKKYVDQVNKDAATVAKGIVLQLQKHGKKDAAAKQVNSKWSITVDKAVLTHDEQESLDVKLMAVTANITITASSADAPAVINSLNGFFSSWRAVVGLIATATAAVYLLKVSRR